MMPDRGPIALDFDCIRQRLTKLAQEAYPEWTDHATPGFGNVLLDLYAYLVDVLGFYIESQAREARLVTATQRHNAVALAAFIGYRATGAAAAQAEVVFSLRKPHSRDVVVPRNYELKTRGAGSAISFRLLDSVTIPAGETVAAGPAEASTLRQEVHDAPGTSGITITLGHPRCLDGSIAVKGPGESAYRAVPNLLDSGAGEQHFVVLHSHNGKTMLKFGDGHLGNVPTGVLAISYATGGGSAGCVEARSIAIASQPIYDADHRPVEVEVTNPAAATGGRDSESIASIKENAPRSYRVAGQSITREDFEINACRVPGVARALMLTSNQDARVEENTGRLYVVPHGGGQMSEAMATEVLRMVTEEYPCTLTFRVMSETAIYRTIDMDVSVELQSWVTDAASVEAAIVKQLGEMFAIEIGGRPNPRVNFGYYARSANSDGGDVAWSDVVTTICLVPGVRKLTRLQLNGEAHDVQLEPFDFPKLGAVRLSLGVRHD